MLTAKCCVFNDLAFFAGILLRQTQDIVSPQGLDRCKCNEYVGWIVAFATNMWHVRVRGHV
jgi:hypothetical protein